MRSLDHNALRHTTAAILLLGAATLPACTVAAASAAVGAAQSGASIIKKGRVTTALLVRYDDVLTGVRQAAATLDLDTRRIVEKDGRTSFFYEEEDGGKIAVYVAHRTDTVTSLIVDVGATGRADVARLMHAQIIDHLAEANAFLEDWTPQTGPVPAASQE
ncbi:MAG: hypothetical protein R3B57_08950 [Phycisphaerales bacterium]